MTGIDMPLHPSSNGARADTEVVDKDRIAAARSATRPAWLDVLTAAIVAGAWAITRLGGWWAGIGIAIMLLSLIPLTAIELRVTRRRRIRVADEQAFSKQWWRLLPLILILAIPPLAPSGSGWALAEMLLGGAAVAALVLQLLRWESRYQASHLASTGSNRTNIA